MLFFKKKKKKTYPCICYLRNALHFIENNQLNEAYGEICYAIVELGEELTSSEKTKFFNLFKKEV